MVLTLIWFFSLSSCTITMGKVLSIFKSRRYNQGGQTEFQPKASQQTKKEFIDFSLPETVVNNAGDNTQQSNIKTS